MNMISRVVPSSVSSLPSVPHSTRMAWSVCVLASWPLWPRVFWEFAGRGGSKVSFCALGQQRSCHAFLLFSLLHERRHPNNPVFGDLFHCNAPRASCRRVRVYNSPFRQSCDREADQYLRSWVPLCNFCLCYGHHRAKGYSWTHESVSVTQDSVTPQSFAYTAVENAAIMQWINRV